MSDATNYMARDARALEISIREKVFPHISRLLELSEGIRDSQTRLLMQSTCLDIVSELEEFSRTTTATEKKQGKHLGQ